MIITIVAIILALLAGSIYAIWKFHEEAKARNGDVIVSASESKPWNPPPRGPKGGDWRNRRKAA
jgi:flagellar basal body-associated protein FliL